MNVSPALLSVVAVVCIQAVAFAFYLGKLSTRVETNSAKLVNHEDRVTELESAQRQDVALGVRLAAIEKMTDRMAGSVTEVRDQVIASKTAGETERSALKRHIEKMEREVGGIHRQLANIATGKTGLLEMTKGSD